MLASTFLHLPGIGLKKEQALWERGIRSWEDYEKQFLTQASLFDETASNSLSSVLEASKKALLEKDANFFAQRLPRNKHFRVALTYPGETAFLDIETTGLSRYYDEITLIGVGIGKKYLCYIKGCDPRPVLDAIASAKCLVTFNGSIFDLKFIGKEFPDVVFPKAHVDLRFFGLPVGLRGSQKKIEHELGLSRHENVESVLGEKAPLLWHDYRLGDINSLKTLIRYNHADVEGMKHIFDVALSQYKKRCPIQKVFGPLPNFSSRQSHITFARGPSTASGNRFYLPKFKGKTGPRITFRDLARAGDIKKLRVVGIDLTGSEKRPSGWCFLEGKRATTSLLSSDKELISETLNARPDVVSIDSPLSLPRGRKRVSDDDPGRKKFGIMRMCERILKKRGVNVYPSLIPSMQGLTRRGILLAKKIRKEGLPVIESYPGAAQDIMGIPRKRAGLEYLRKGLRDFGVLGEFLDRDISHDELDAVTSAIVGLFFWTGKYEGLGNMDEDYLIIPDLKVDPKNWNERTAIGISGPIAAGKTTAAEYLAENKGFTYARYSMILEEEARKSGITKITRDLLQERGRKAGKNQRAFNKKVFDSLPREGAVVIDGMRFPEDHASMVEFFGPAFRHIHVEASEEIREARHRKRGQPKKAFIAASRDKVEAKIPLLRELAHMRVLNEEKIRGFTSKVERFIINHYT